ncbi:MAG: outer membrane protein assembly factor BamE [Pseudomonadota bacterium]
MQLRAIIGFGAALTLCVAACSPIYSNHGYLPPQEDLNELTVGVDTRETVDDVVGAPSSSGVLSGGDYYYIRTRIKAVGPRKPEVIERQVLAISFAPNDTIANIERFSLADGRVVPLTRRVTESSVRDRGFIQQLLGNIGAVDAESVFGDGPF